jgi:phosphoenolpyruvate carboxykinase (GTP)
MTNQNHLGERTTDNRHVIEFVQSVAQRTQPDRIWWCDGSEAEKAQLTEEACAHGILIKLNQEKWPGCYYHRSNPNDVARVEQCTYICSETEEEAGPTNNWMAPVQMYTKLHALLEGAMQQRTLYVIPYLMGPPGSPLTKVGIEVTDSLYVVLSMRIMTRMGAIAYRELGESSHFNRGIHAMLDVHPDRRIVAHFPEDNAIISVGSNYGGNVLLGKKCLALRIGSRLARKEGWMAEHMLVLGVESPEGEKTYVAAAFPSACGKTNFAMMIPPKRFKGWKITTVGDDIAWMKPGPDGRLYAINPENGYFGVVPGTNSETNRNAVKTITRDTIFTNVALLPDGDVWWEGKDGPVPEECLDWKGERWVKGAKEKAAHPNSRFAAPMTNNPELDSQVENPQGVPIDAIIFGGRRASTIPLVYQAFNWVHGVYVGATMGSETTAAAVGGTGQVRRDPMAMLPFCGLHMGDYFHNWLRMRGKLKYPPRIFGVNWFRKDEHGIYIWPGFGENMRVLKWVVDRCRGKAGAYESTLGWVPYQQDMDLADIHGFKLSDWDKLMDVNIEEWRREVISQDELFIKLYGHLPKEIIFQRELLVSRL